ncbi:hypothetical protein J2X71_001643 [Rhizobium sp. 1399]|jgi:hypothetical protein|nr:hypothetical protein [Rhizobium sp. 1399]
MSGNCMLRNYPEPQSLDEQDRVAQYCVKSPDSD